MGVAKVVHVDGRDGVRHLSPALLLLLDERPREALRVDEVAFEGGEDQRVLLNERQGQSCAVEAPLPEDLQRPRVEV